MGSEMGDTGIEFLPLSCKPCVMGCESLIAPSNSNAVRLYIVKRCIGRLRVDRALQSKYNCLHLFTKKI